MIDPSGPGSSRQMRMPALSALLMRLPRMMTFRPFCEWIAAAVAPSKSQSSMLSAESFAAMPLPAALRKPHLRKLMPLEFSISISPFTPAAVSGALAWNTMPSIVAENAPEIAASRASPGVVRMVCTPMTCSPLGMFSLLTANPACPPGSSSSRPSLAAASKAACSLLLWSDWSFGSSPKSPTASMGCAARAAVMIAGIASPAARPPRMRRRVKMCPLMGRLSRNPAPSATSPARIGER